MNLVGANQITTNRIVNYTGLGAVTVLGVNPSKERLEEILGREIGYEPNYDIKESSLTKSDYRPLEFWVRNIETGSVIRLNFEIGTNLIESKTNKYKFVNHIGQMAWLDHEGDNPVIKDNMSWYKEEGARPMTVNEDKLFSFLQKLGNYNSRVDNANWLEFTSEHKLNAEDVFSGNYEGISKYIEYVTSMDINKIIMLHIVREKMKEGEEKPRYYQELLTNPDTWFTTFSGEVTPKMKEKVISLHEDAQNNGRSLTTRFFSTDWLEFSDENKIKMIGYKEVPESTSNGAGFSWS